MEWLHLLTGQAESTSTSTLIAHNAIHLCASAVIWAEWLFSLKITLASKLLSASTDIHFLWFINVWNENILACCIIESSSIDHLLIVLGLPIKGNYESLVYIIDKYILWSELKFDIYTCCLSILTMINLRMVIWIETVYLS